MNPPTTSSAEASRRMTDAGWALRPVGPRPAFVHVHVHESTYLLSTNSYLLKVFNFNFNFNFNLKPRPRASRGKAFTLVELMVAGTITTILLLGMAGVFDQSMKAWRLSSRRADAEREVRAALSQIQRDLSGLVVNSNLPIYVNIGRTNQVNVPNKYRFNFPPSTGPQGQDWSNASIVLFFASRQPPGGTDAGDIAGIGYFVAFDTNSNLPYGAWNLYRRYQSPSNLIQGLRLRNALLSNPSTTFNASTRGPYDANVIPEPELMAANVMNLWVQFAIIKADGTAATMPTNNQGDFDFPALVSGAWITNRPSFAQLELTAYSGDHVRAFSNRAVWANTTNLQQLGRSFIWRVDL